MAQAAQAVQTPPALKRWRLITEDRMKAVGFVHGDMMHVTLPGEETIEEGVQDVERWAHLGPRLGTDQWLEITNDARSMWHLMRVEQVHGDMGTGLRHLVLRDIVPPRIVDVGEEPIARTGDWYVRYLGPHRKWAVITPQGGVRREGINTESEAKTACQLEARNPRPR